MPQRIVVLPITGDYPFAATSEHLVPNTTVHTRLALPLANEPRPQLRQRIRLLRNLGCQHLVGLVGTSQEEGFIFLTFEYVASSLTNAVGRLSPEVVARLRSEAEALASSLACHGVDHALQLSRVGIDSRQHLKYFLGVDFRIDRSLNRPEILQKYVETAHSFFAVTPRGSPAKPQEYSETMDSCTRIRPMKTSYTAVENVGVSPRAHVKREEIPPVAKMEELGARIGRLKNYMHDLKGKTGANVKDMANPHLYIERKIAEFRLSNANIERRIAEFRESKLLKERESHHAHSSQRHPLPTSPRNLHAPDSPLKNEPKGRVPAYLLQRKDPPDPKPLTSSKTLPKEEEAKAKQYLKLAAKDKYCQEFLCILEDEPMPKSSPSTDSLKLSEQRVRERIQEHLQDDSAAEIQSRVKKAIRNSIKLINGLKARETIHCT